MKFVQENLYEFQDYNFFSVLNEAEEEDKKEMSPEEKKKMREQKLKNGMAVVKKVQKNFNEFKKHAGGKWQEYRDFWETQKVADESVQQEGKFYNLWNSDYIVGIVKEPNGAAALKVFNTSAEDENEYVVYSCKIKEVIQEFRNFLSEFKAAIKAIEIKQREAMKIKKQNEKLKKKEEAEAKRKSKLDAFLGESKRSTGIKN